jgi:hypothetical protein
MTTDKLYSKKFIIYKVIFAALLPLLTLLFSMLFDSDNAVIQLFATVFFMGLIYSAPYLLTLMVLRKEVAVGIGRLVFLDTVTLLFPIIISTVLCDAFFSVSGGQAQGFFSVIVIGVVVMLTLVFWSLYMLFRKKQ